MTSTQITARQGMYAKLSPRDAVAHALTAYDRANARRRSHNPRLIGIALVSLDEIAEENPNATIPEILAEGFSGRLLAFLIRELGLSDRYTVGRRGDLERLEEVAR